VASFSVADASRLVPRFSEMAGGPAERFGDGWATWLAVPLPLFGTLDFILDDAIEGRLDEGNHLT